MVDDEFQLGIAALTPTLYLQRNIENESEFRITEIFRLLAGLWKRSWG